MSDRDASGELPIRLGGLALAVGAFGVPLGAQASVVTYSTAQTLPASIYFNPTTGAIGPGATSQFTVNLSSGSTGSIGHTAEADGSATANISAYVSSSPFNAAGDAVKYSAGSTIGASSFTGTSSPNPTAPMDTSDPIYAKSDSPYYIAFRVQVPGSGVMLTSTTPSYNYGYAEYDTISATPILMYAFETQADTSITIPTAVPEPASLALLAMGAAGVAGLRRRRGAA